MVEKVFNDHCTNEHNWGKFACPNENCEFVSYSQESYGKNLTQACPRKIARRNFKTCTAWNGT